MKLDGTEGGGTARRSIGPDKRARVLAMYDGRCAICGCKPPELTVDHVIPLSLGGTNDESNLQPACRRCNSLKADIDPGPRIGRWYRVSERAWVLADAIGETRLHVTKRGTWRIVDQYGGDQGAALTSRDLIDAAAILLSYELANA